MKNYLTNKPSKRITWILLVIGLVVFVPIYSYMLKLFKVMNIDSREFQHVMTWFNGDAYRDFSLHLEEGGHLQTFIWTYWLNILSVTGFMLGVFSITLLIARNIKAAVLAKVAFVFPILPPIIAILDIFPSLLIISVGKDLPTISDSLVYIIDACYIVRIILVDLTLFWIVIAIIYLIIQQIRNK
jgi:hypothetical protein